MSETVSLAQAIAALARGEPLALGELIVGSVETMTDAALAAIDPRGAASLLVSAERAAALNLANRRDVVPGQPVEIARCDWLDRDLVRALAEPARDFERIVPGPLAVATPAQTGQARAALELARLAGLLPALWKLPATAALAFDPALLARPASASIVARARLPVEDVGEGQMVVFRDDRDGTEHVALVLGAPGGDAPLVRLHSECLTGDVFGSLKCDCGPQLKEALRLIAAGGGGILLYLRQEGRGIGLANKVRAYALQDRGLDTVEANARLGFPDDARDYRLAAAMLRALGVGRVRLLTNNPRKVDGLAAEGIAVAERVAHHMPANPHNADYLAVKRRKSGHLD